MNRISLPPHAPALHCPASTPAGLPGSAGEHLTTKGPAPGSPLWPSGAVLYGTGSGLRGETDHPLSKLLVSECNSAAVAAGVPFQLHPHDVGVGTGIKSQRLTSPVNPDVAVTDWVYFSLG